MRPGIALLLAACTLVGCLAGPAEPMPTPHPTATLTPAPRYYPTLDPSLRQELMYRIPKPEPYYHLDRLADGREYEAFRFEVVSSGQTSTLQAGQYTLDVVWVYERNAVGAVQYPLVVGAWDGTAYTPYYTRFRRFHQPGHTTERQSYLAYLEENEILARGRYLLPNIADRKGGFVSLYGLIDWQKCGETTFCQVGRYMQTTYQLDAAVVGQYLGLNPIPEGWALAWMWDAATTENTACTTCIFLDLP